ncbi:MAG: precorrin-8X methylmutase [Thiothrix sp.]|nr:precorrin-8X methylmutase [Thiothrix sp.]HPE59953.1 precorrin-8X methylmutase [Thiolinea sp.]
MHYLRDPEKINVQVWERIRELAVLDRFSSEERQLVLHLIRECGDPALAERIHFSPNAIEAGKNALKNYAYILYDYETVRCGLDQALLTQEPMSFVSKALVISLAKANKQTRAMASISQWKKYSKGCIALFGKSGSALCHLLELLRAREMEAPALVIATNAGFVNAGECKQFLIESFDELGVEFIVVEGTYGGVTLASTAMNALLMLQRETYV